MCRSFSDCGFFILVRAHTRCQLLAESGVRMVFSDSLSAFLYFFLNLLVTPHQCQFERSVGVDGHLRLLVGRAAACHLERDEAVGAVRIAVDAVAVGKTHVERYVVFLHVGTYSEDVFNEFGDWWQTCPAHKVLACHESGFGFLRCVVFPESSRFLIYLQHVVVMVHGDVVRQTAVAFVCQTGDYHVVGARPHSAGPVTAVGLVLGIVGCERRHAVRTVELGGVLEMAHQCVESFLGQYVGVASRRRCPAWC